MSTLWSIFLLLAVLGRTALATEYVVAPNGNDTNPGNDAHPFRTIARGMLPLVAGDTLLVRPGTYSESIVIARAGTAAAPITVRGMPGTVLVNPQPGTSRSAVDVYAAAAYVSVTGFEITGNFGETIFVRTGAQDITLAGLDIHHNQSGIWIAGASRVTVHDSRVHHNTRSGIRIFSGARDVLITDVLSAYQNDGLGCSGDADGVSADQTVSNLTLVRVQSSYNSEDGFDIGAPNVEMREVEAQGNACSGVKLGGGGMLQNVLIAGSRIGLNISSTTQSPTMLVNSTLLDNGIGVRALGAQDQVDIQNCIVSGVGKALTISANVQLHEDHNIFFRPDADSRLIVRAMDGGELLYSGADVNAGLWQVASGGQGNETVAVDPGLDASGRPMGPRGPAIDSGTAAANVPIDLVGGPRPMGRAVDRGAFEYEPAPTSAVVTRVVVRGEGDGRGELRLSMNLSIPDDLPVDITSETIRLVVRGSAGTVVTAQIDDANRSGRAAGDARRRVRFRRGGSERMTVTVRQTTTMVRVSLRAAGVNVAALATDEIWVDIVAGDLLATAHAALRNNAGRLSLP